MNVLVIVLVPVGVIEFVGVPGMEVGVNVGVGEGVCVAVNVEVGLGVAVTAGLMVK